MIWIPRSVEPRKNKNNNDNILTITELEETQLTVVEKGKEVQLTELVEKKLVIIDQTKQNKDNIRKNHFKNKNSNVVSVFPFNASILKADSKQNTVVIVVTQIVDIRDSSNVNTRYMTHQVQSNEEITEQQIVIVSEAVAMTVGGGSSGTQVQPASPTGTGFISPNIMTYDPSAPPSVSNNSMILPAGVSAPNFDNTQVDQDPAIIIEENQAVFVEFVQSS